MEKKIIAFNIEPDEEKIRSLDLDRIQELADKEEEIQQRTDNKIALAHIPQVARDQAEMVKLSQALINQTGKNRNNPYICLAMALKMSVTRDACGDYYVSMQIASDEPFVKPFEKTGSKIGIDLNVENFYADSFGNIVDNPRYYKKIR